MVQVCSLASGSSGNAYLFCTKDENILVDAGISWRRISSKLAELGRPKIDAALITHEHIDHVRALGQLQKAGIQLYMSKGTLNAYRSLYGDIETRIIKANEQFRIGEVTCVPFGKCHDALEPLSYALSHSGKTVSYMTDLGHMCKDSKEMIAMSDATFIESNHDVEMLRHGRYPAMLKKRILGRFGHLSNEDSAMGVLENATPKLKNAFLSHLSESNNTHDIALGTFGNIVKERRDLDICCKISPRHNTGPLVKI
jgi:phosphoribosyl 1,2-cyclic phosphodiesterase